jgi:hypothetical protein
VYPHSFSPVVKGEPGILLKCLKWILDLDDEKQDILFSTPKFEFSATRLYGVLLVFADQLGFGGYLRERAIFYKTRSIFGTLLREINAIEGNASALCLHLTHTFRSTVQFDCPGPSRRPVWQSLC